MNSFVKRLTILALLALMGAGVALPAAARDNISIGIGGGGYYPSRYYNPYYTPYYGYPYYYAPPPTVVYASPAPTTYVVPQQAPDMAPAPQYYNQAPPAAAAPSTTTADPTFVDKKGRTCRKFQTSIDGAPVTGTACLQADGSWRSVDE